MIFFNARRFSSQLFLCFGLAMLSACQPTRTKLVIYSTHGKEMLGYYEQKFKAANPDADVTWLDMGSQTAFERLSTEKENPQADLWWGGPKELFTQAEARGLLEPFQPSWAAAVPEAFKSKSSSWYAAFSTPEVIMFNTQSLAAADVPKDWDELLSPKWKGKIIIRDPAQSGTMRTIFAAMIAKEKFRTGSADSGFAWLRRLDANTKDYCPDPTQLYLNLARGQTPLTLWNLTDALIQSQKNHYPFGFVIPASGTVSVIEGIAVVKNAKQIALAKKFYEFVTTPESLAEQAELFYRVPARTDVDATRNPAWLKALTLKPLQLNAADAAQNEAAWLVYWQENIKAKN